MEQISSFSVAFKRRRIDLKKRLFSDVSKYLTEFQFKITPYGSMVDTDQEKEALSILSAKSRSHGVEEKEEEK